MNMDTEQHKPETPEDETLARHKRMAEVLDGKRPMDWSDWAMFIHESKCLTTEGQRVALWATATLQHALGDDFLQRVVDWLARIQAKDPDLAPDLHPIFSLGLWPANDLPWVYANLIRLAARIQLFLPDRKNRRGRVLKTLRKNLEPINWGSAWLQFEVAALGLKAGWEVLFEPPLGSGRSADIRLTSGTTQLFVETTMMRMSVEERKALAVDRRLAWQLQSLEWQHDVRISGSVSRAALEEPDIREQWLQAVAEAARATAQDNRSRHVPGPAGVSVTVFRPPEATIGEQWGIEGDPVEARILDRLIALLGISLLLRRHEKRKEMPREPLGDTSFLTVSCLNYAVFPIGTLRFASRAGAGSLPEGTRLHHLLYQRSTTRSGRVRVQE